MRGISSKRFFHYFIGFVFLMILIFPHPLLRSGLSLWRGEKHPIFMGNNVRRL